MNIELIIQKYSKLIYKICFDMLSNTKDAEDLTQETYLALYCNFDKYMNLNEKEIKNITCKIALNKCRDYLKSTSKKIENMTDDDPEILNMYKEKNSIEKEILENENIEYIQNKIKELKEPYKTLVYYYIRGISLDELSKRENKTKATLKTQLYRAKKILKEIMIKEGGEDFL